MKRVDTHGFRMLNGVRDLETPPVDTGYEVWSLPALPAQVDGRHHWRMGIRLGPNASGEGANYVVSVKSARPSHRKVGFREILEALPIQAQVGYFHEHRGLSTGAEKFRRRYPPSTKTEACLGYTLAPGGSHPV